jgi:hypothetical protein
MTLDPTVSNPRTEKTMNWLWAYFRKKAMESIIAGVHDALVSGSGPTGLSDEQAFNAFHAITGTPVPVPPATTALAAPPPPQIAGPGGNGPPAPPDEPRRGPGRPRKFLPEEPPQ